MNMSSIINLMTSDIMGLKECYSAFQYNNVHHDELYDMAEAIVRLEGIAESIKKKELIKAQHIDDMSTSINNRTGDEKE
jgi:hypothetical protein